MTTSDKSTSGVCVSLREVELWQKFYPDNEMLVTKVGRKLFPSLEFTIDGLNPDALYTVSMYLERVNNVRYIFAKDDDSKTGKWEAIDYVIDAYPIEKRQHTDGVMVGKHWMRSYVLFSNIYITNDPKIENNLKKKNLIHVTTMHKYQPVITVKRMSDGYEEEFRLTVTEFIVVTVYQNPKIVELKKQNNKYYCGLVREKNNAEQSNRSVPQGRKRAITSDNSTPSPLSAITPPTKTAPPPSRNPMHYQNHMMAPTGTIPPAGTTPPTPITPHQMMNPQAMARAPATGTPQSYSSYPTPQPFDGLNNDWNQMNSYYNPYGTSNMNQINVAPMPPQTQWNTMPGPGHSQNFDQFGNTGNAQQMSNNHYQYTDYNQAETFPQENSSGTDFDFRF